MGKFWQRLRLGLLLLIYVSELATPTIHCLHTLAFSLEVTKAQIAAIMEYAEYLNEYLKSVDSLPADLEQSLTKMREIGLKNHIASRKCDQLVTRYTHRYPELKKSEQSELVRQIRELNSKQKQFCDEQVKLATGTYELVDKHVRQLDATLARFEAELKDSKVFGGLQSNSPTALAIPNFGSDALSTLGAAATSSQSQALAVRGSQKQREMSGAQKQKASGTLKRDGSTVDSKRKRKLILGGDVTPKGSSNKRKRDDLTKVSVALPIPHSFISNGDSVAALGGEPGASTSVPSTSTSVAPLASGVSAPSAAASRLSVASLVRSIGGACGEVLDMPVDPAEPTYCVCHQVSFGEMVACDNPECPVEWFHFACVGLTANPRGKWFCPLCSRNTTKTPKPIKPATPAATAQGRVEKKPKKRD